MGVKDDRSHAKITGGVPHAFYPFKEVGSGCSSILSKPLLTQYNIFTQKKTQYNIVQSIHYTRGDHLIQHDSIIKRAQI